MKPVEVVTFPGKGFFSKPLRGLVIIRGSLMVDRVEHGEGGRQPSYQAPGLTPFPACIWSQTDMRQGSCLWDSARLLSVGPYCQGLCPAGGLRVHSSLSLIIPLPFHNLLPYNSFQSHLWNQWVFFFLLDLLLGSLPEIFTQGSLDPFLWIWGLLPNQFHSGSPYPNPTWSPCCCSTLVILNNPSLVILSNPHRISLPLPAS